MKVLFRSKHRLISFTYITEAISHLLQQKRVFTTIKYIDDIYQKVFGPSVKRGIDGCCHITEQFMIGEKSHNINVY